MTVIVQTPYSASVANGVTTLFGFDFQLLDAADLQVSLDGVVQSTGFTIAGIGVQSGGSITFAVAPASNVLVEIQRLIPLARSTDYQLNGDLPSDQVDRDFDRLWMALQGQAAAFDGVLRAPYPESLDDLPAASSRAGKALAFDLSGQPVLLDASSAVTSAGSVFIADAGNKYASDTVEGALQEVATLSQLAQAGGSSLVGFAQSGAGAVTRSLQSKARDVVSVKDFGAVGDGVADDTAEIQAALDAALAVSFGGPGDNYRVSAALVLRNGHYLNLNGATITQATDQTPIFNANSKSDVTITGGRFVGKTEATFTNTPSSQAIAIRADGATDLSVVGNLFENFHYSALMVGTAGTRIDFSHNTVIGPGAPVLGVNTNFRNCTGATIIGSDVRIHGNSIRAVAQGLIVGQGSNQVTITGNVISALVNEHGMYIDTGVRKLAIIGNIVQGTGVFGMGIKVQYYNSFGVTPDAIVISDNVISDAQQDGILVDNTDVSPTIRAVGVTISGNTILNAGAYGIDVRDAIDCTVANNTIVNPQQCGIALDNAASVLIEGNLIRGASRSGIRDLSACSSVRILNNMIRDCAVGNVANDEYGIFILLGSEYVISGNIIQDSAANMQYGLFIGSPVNATLTLTDNTVVGMSDTGIRFAATTGLREYRRNNFNGNIAATFNDPVLPSVASASTITLPSSGDVVLVTGTSTINTINANGHSGRRVTLVFSDALQVTRASGNVILNQAGGNFTTTANDTLTLVCNGTTWYEVSRSAN